MQERSRRLHEIGRHLRLDNLDLTVPIGIPRVSTISLMKGCSGKKAVPGGASIARPANWIRPTNRGGPVNYYRYGYVTVQAERLCRKSGAAELHRNFGSTNADKEQNDEPIAAVLSRIIHQLIR